MAGRKDYAAAVAALWRDVEGREGMHVLDASAGTGKSTRELLALGMQVTATNYDEARPATMPGAAAFVGGVDLNGRWPFEDASFGGVHLQEVIEHLENPAHVLRECARVLRPHGVLVLSTPNILNAGSRLRFLLTGFFEGQKRPISYAKPTGNAGNVYVTNLRQMHYLLAQCGLSVEALGIASWEWRTLLAAIPFYPLFALGTWIATTRVRKKDLLPRWQRRAGVPEEELDTLQEKQRRVQRRLRRLMLSKAAVLARGIVIRARKTGAPPMEA